MNKLVWLCLRKLYAKNGQQDGLGPKPIIYQIPDLDDHIIDN